MTLGGGEVLTRAESLGSETTFHRKFPFKCNYPRSFSAPTKAERSSPIKLHFQSAIPTYAPVQLYLKTAGCEQLLTGARKTGPSVVM